MSLAEATALLRQKESDKMTCLDVISKLEAAQYNGSIGKVSVAVQGVKHARKEAFKFVTKVGGFKSEPMGLSEEVIADSIMSDDKDIRIDAVLTGDISAEGEEASAPSEITYRASLEIAGLPTDTFLQTEIDATSTLNEQDKIALVVKISFSPLSEQIASKKSELDQIYKEMDAVKEAIKARSSSTSSTSSKPASSTKASKTKKASASSSKKSKKASAQEESSSESAATGLLGGNLLNSVTQSLVTGGALAIQHYSVPLFVAATAAIFMYGDYASV